MGLCGSKVTPNTQHVTPSRQKSHRALFSGLALKFPYIRKSFHNVRRAYLAQMGAGPDSLLSTNQLGDVLKKMGAANLTHDEITQLFHLSDLDGSKDISFREFLIAIGIGYYLNENYSASENDDPQFEETRKGFLVVKEAFEKIDADHGGTIDLDELKTALFDVSSGQYTNDILHARFKELDFDEGGDIDFPEFLYGFSKWVGMDDEDEEEEEKKEEQ